MKQRICGHLKPTSVPECKFCFVVGKNVEGITFPPSHPPSALPMSSLYSEESKGERSPGQKNTMRGPLPPLHTTGCVQPAFLGLKPRKPVFRCWLTAVCMWIGDHLEVDAPTVLSVSCHFLMKLAEMWRRISLLRRDSDSGQLNKLWPFTGSSYCAQETLTLPECPAQTFSTMICARRFMGCTHCGSLVALFYILFIRSGSNGNTVKCHRRGKMVILNPPAQRWHLPLTLLYHWVKEVRCWASWHRRRILQPQGKTLQRRVPLCLVTIYRTHCALPSGHPPACYVEHPLKVWRLQACSPEWDHWEVMKSFVDGAESEVFMSLSSGPWWHLWEQSLPVAFTFTSWL